MGTLTPPRRCTRCPHWELFPVDGVCCTSLEHIMLRQAHGAELRAAQPATLLPGAAGITRNSATIGRVRRR
jgi:hypothetical protein